MELTEKDLRERGIRRSRKEVTEEAGRFAYAILAGMPTGRWVPEPIGELSSGEAEVMGEGGLDLSPPAPDEPDPLAVTASRYAALLATASPRVRPWGCWGSARSGCARGWGRGASTG